MVAWSLGSEDLDFVGYIGNVVKLKKKTKMASATKADRKAALDAGAWMFNVVTSVGIIIVNKALMATYGFSFGNFLIVSTFFSHLFLLSCYWF